ncbi:SGNH/GDSL hydrolase family protein [Bacillus mobilis]|uniref:SGNH/GDSL hydrolase family protein n=1 Tax=Bacillus mobilis TaxID=2026190 RepID=UPI002E226648|nr:SGNH/GDSL hydrolase family protein [Bacillus mobilis]
MKKIFMVGFVAVAIAVITLGNMYWNNKIKATTQEANHKAQGENVVGKNAINILKERKADSILDWLKYTSTQKESINMSVLGSSVTAGDGASDIEKSWAKLFANYLTALDGVNQINLVRNGYSGYSTANLIDNNKISEVIKNKPDIIFFELCLLNNAGQNIPLEKTYEDIDNIIGELKNNLPESLIVLQTADSIPNDKRNKVGLTYDDYNREVKKYAVDKGYNFIDTYEEFKGIVQKEKLNYKDILVDGIHPNDEGYKIWFNILKENINKTPAK